MSRIKTNKKIVQKQPSRFTDVTAVRLSHTLFFGIILSLSLLVGGLLFGACFSVARMSSLPDRVPPKSILENNVRALVSGYPIEAMASRIALENKTTAAFLVGIAKKESNWGKRVPRDEQGNDCFNYWGWRGAGSRGIAMGHGCFGSREEAIGIVSGRLDTLIQKYRRDTPAEMIVWKCGTDCAGHSPESVRKWISDVDFYFKKIN